MTDPTEARAALLREFDGSVCPACHHRVHDPGGCSECPRCELHTDEAFAFVLRYQPALATLDCNLVKHGAAPCLAALPDDGREGLDVERLAKAMKALTDDPQWTDEYFRREAAALVAEYLALVPADKP